MHDKPGLEGIPEARPLQESLKYIQYRSRIMEKVREVLFAGGKGGYTNSYTDEAV